MMKPINKIAIVDDDNIYVYLTTEMVKTTHLVKDISVFGNGREAITYLDQHKDQFSQLPEIILLDLSMPIMDGWQFLNEFVKLSPKLDKTISVYICSSSISPDDVSRARSISAVSDYVLKPVTSDSVISMIKDLKN